MGRRLGTCLLMALALGTAFPGLARDRPPVVAVFDIQVKGLKLDPDVVDRLTDYLAGRMGEGGRYQVVPRDQLKQRLVEAKTDSYRDCYAQSCQIELGQELAADKTLATQVLKLGSACKVSLALWDLKRSTSENTTAASGTCTEDGIVASLEAAVVRLTGGASVVADPAPKARDGDGPAVVTGESKAGGPRAKEPAPLGVGPLMIQSTPPGATLMVDGRQVGTTPWQDPMTAVGTHKVTIFQAGHRQWDMEVRVQPGQTSKVTATLEPLMGTVVVSAEVDDGTRKTPVEAMVLVDGTSKGRTPGTLSLLSVEHEITAEFQGTRLSKKVRVVEGSVVPVSFRFEAETLKALQRELQWEKENSCYRGSWTQLYGLGMAPAMGHYLTTSGDLHALLSLPLLGMGFALNIDRIFSFDFTMGATGVGGAGEPEGRWAASGFLGPIEFQMTFQFGRSSPFAARIGLWGFANLWTTATREVGRLVAGAASAHLVYDHGVMKDRFHFEVEAGFQYVGWWGKWYKEGFRTDSAGDPMGGGRLLISVPVFGNPKTRFLMGAGYYRGARGAQDVQWLLTFRDFFW